MLIEEGVSPVGVVVSAAIRNSVGVGSDGGSLGALCVSTWYCLPNESSCCLQNWLEIFELIFSAATACDMSADVDLLNRSSISLVSSRVTSMRVNLRRIILSKENNQIVIFSSDIL